MPVVQWVDENFFKHQQTFQYEQFWHTHMHTKYIMLYVMLYMLYYILGYPGGSVAKNAPDKEGDSGN